LRRFAVTVCYIRDARDGVFNIDRRARETGVDYVELLERHSFDASVWPALRRVVRERRIDLVHGHDYKTHLLAWLLARTEHIIPLATAHGWDGHHFREKWFYYPGDKLLMSRFPRLIAVSRGVRDALVKAGADPGRTTVVLNGIDCRAFRRDRGQEADARARLGLHPGDWVVGAVGRLEPAKRFDVLMHAVAMLRGRHGNLKLVIAGDGGSRQHLERLGHRLFDETVCRFLGHRADISALHHAFDVFVQSSDHEGTSNAVLEAMALETPVVATDAGGTSELAQDGIHALIVPPGAPEALAGAIERSIAEPAATVQRVAAARTRVEHELSFDARMRAVEAIYEELLSAPSEHHARR
jgi:glycosyltransferase involved in cell wall biosynthesis